MDKESIFKLEIPSEYIETYNSNIYFKSVISQLTANQIYIDKFTLEMISNLCKTIKENDIKIKNLRKVERDLKEENQRLKNNIEEYKNEIRKSISNRGVIK